MKKYLDGAGLKNVLGRLKGKLDLKADKAELAVQSNPNLLDNWYFVGGGSQQGGGQFPINQRGQTEYHTDSGFIYIIDRWLIDAGLSVNLNDDGVLLTASSASRLQMTQRLETSRFVPGETYTISLLVNVLAGGKAIVSFYQDKGGWPAGDTSGDSEGIYLLKDTFTWDGTNTSCYFSIFADKGSVKLLAAKLEQDTIQTLAHQDVDGSWVLNDSLPDYGTELLKCQRYYHIFATADKRPAKKEDFCPPMRIDPTLTEIQINGQTYYAADANL